MTSSSPNTEQMLEHAAWIRSLARQLVGHGSDAEDLVQETWVAALRRGPDDSRSLRPWLARVLRNLAHQAYRHEAAGPKTHPIVDLSHPIPSPDELVARGETQALLVQEVLALREPFRRMVILRYYEGLTPAQIAQALGLPAATVRGRLKRALDELRSRLDETQRGNRQAWMLACVPLAAGQSPTMVSVMFQGNGLKWVLTASALLTVALGGSYWLALEPVAEEREVAELEMTSTQEAPPLAPVDVLPKSEQRADPARVALESNPEHHASWSARLVDTVTGEPVPDYLMHVEQDGVEEVLHSDGGGFFEVQMALHAGPFRMCWRDAPGVPISVSWDFVTGEVDSDVPNWITDSHDPLQTQASYPIRVGPTYSFNLLGAGALELTDLRARLSTLDSPQGRTAGGRIPVVLRSGLRPWVRFARLPDFYQEAERCRLELRSTNGYWAGTAAVESIIGIQRRPVPVQLEARGRLRGVVQGLGGASLEKCTVSLERIEPDLAADGVPNSALVSRARDGSFQFEYLEAGSYRISLRAPGRQSVQRLVEVVALSTEELQVSLEREAKSPERGQASIRGVLRSASGEYQEDTLLMLHGLGPEGIRESSPVAWTRVGKAMEGAYEFAGLDAGGYELSVFSLLSSFEWSPAQTVEAPARGIDFLVQDDVPTSELRLDVRSTETGESVEPFQLGWSTNGGGVLVRRVLPGESVHLPSIPNDAQLVWAVHAPGYATSYGDLRDFSPTQTGVSVARVEVTRGWRIRLRVFDVQKDQPASGAAIFIAGQQVAVTDRQGLVTIERERAPLSIEVRFSGQETMHNFFSPDMPWVEIRLK